MSARLSRNTALLTVFQLGKMAVFPVAVLPLFMAEQCGLSTSEVMSLQALFGLTIALSEFPSGYIADRIGYRRTLLAGSFITLAGWAVYPLAWDFASLLVGEVLLAVGLACISGCDSALLYESLHATGHSERFGPTYARQLSFGQLGEGSAALSAGWLYLLDARLPFYLQVLCTGVAIAALWPIEEPARVRVTRSGSHLRQAITLVQDALGKSPRLGRLIALWTAFSLAGYVPVWLFAPYARESGVPVAWLGPLWALSNYLVALGALFGGRLLGRLGALGAATVALALLVLGYAGLSLGAALYGCLFYFAICAMRGVVTAVLPAQEQALIDSGDRAALVSFRSTLFRLGFFVVGPVIGWLVDRYGYEVAFAAAGIPIACVVALWLRPALRAPIPEDRAALAPAAASSERQYLRAE